MGVRANPVVAHTRASVRTVPAAFEVAEPRVPGVAELARLDASRRHTAGEAAARHGTAGRSGEDDETTEPRA
jgi:hypothetical protein